LPQPRQVWTLEVTAAPGLRTVGLKGDRGRIPLANYSASTLRQLRELALIEFPTDPAGEAVRITPAGSRVAEPDRRRRELDGIAAVPV
jgi:hypothetical protein